MTKLNVTELDFEQIKENLKTYLKNQDEFTDYDFDGSGLNVLLDVLAYNTHFNALNAHYAMNEAFLDSAQIRGNVITRAKMLGYTPRSVLSPRATINMTIFGGDTQPNTLTLPRGTRFTTTVDNTEYSYVTLSEQVAAKISPGDGTVAYNFSNVEIVEGTLKKVEYTVNNNINNQKFQLSDTDADTSTLQVSVKQNAGDTTGEVYSLFENIADVRSDSQVYWLQENANEFYEVYFGDNVTGLKPLTNNIIKLEYVHTAGEATNGASAFTLATTLLQGSFATITTTSAASGGQQAETTESVRFNAPLRFAAQNRAVTSDDYRALIKAGFSNVDSISVWGGEDNETPDFGKVYIAIKPSVGDNLTDEQKEFIINTVLKGKTVATVIPVIEDVDYTYIELDVNVRYNPNLTDRTNNEIVTLVGDVISNYSFNRLNDFAGVFRHSTILQAIDVSEPSILSSSVRPRMFKNVALSATNPNNIVLNYASSIYSGKDEDVMNITSTGFLYNGDTCFIGDVKREGNPGLRDVVIYKQGAGSSVRILKFIGTLEFSTGIITFSDFNPDADTTVKIDVIPDSLDIAPKRNQLLSIDSNYVEVVAEVDEIAASGQVGGINYTTTPRFK